MGVHGLWELLTPVGRRVSVETLAGKRLAIDASIWMVQFMKAMRDERGEMVRNAHLLGFFRRICKLLFLRTKPVFVFDGATPELKRRTVASRRRHRDSAQAKVRKTAEKLLLNHLKAMRLQELADDIKNQRQKQKNGTKSKKISSNLSNLAGNEPKKNDASSLDEMLAASIAAEEDGSIANISATPDAIPCDEDGDEDEEMVLPDMIGEVDPAVLAALTPSLQFELLQRQKGANDAKGKKIVSDNEGGNLEMEEMVSTDCSQLKLDEMLAASLMEEENRRLINNASTSASYPVEEDGDKDEDEDEDEEMIVPAMDGEVDPSILASLPPSLQLDLLVQIRERLMAENRQKYQKVKKDPGKFSELQIQSYLKTVAFRREIDQVQKAASGRGVGGVQTSRIASEANREFIFSSSFTGDKQVLMSGRAEKCGNEQQRSEERSSAVMCNAESTSKSVTGSEEHSASVIRTDATTSKSKAVTGPKEHSSSVTHSVASTSKSETVKGSKPNRVGRTFEDNIETYLDEQGRVRVSRVRAMGIRMTRDLQRNLDLMKEIEQERENVDRVQRESNNAVSTTHSGNAMAGSHDVAESIKLSNADKTSTLHTDASIEISFEDDCDIKCFDDDDDIFTRLVAENSVRVSDNIAPPEKMSSASDSDCDWEEGIVEANGKPSLNNAKLSTKPLYSEGYNGDGSDVEWEEGNCEDSKYTALPVAEKRELNSKGYLEEEANLQEAIRRSLGDLEGQKSDDALHEDGKLELFGSNAGKVRGFLHSTHNLERQIFHGVDGIQQSVSTCEILDGVGVGGASKSADSPLRPPSSSIVCNLDEATPCESHIGSPKRSTPDASKEASLSKESPYTESLATLGVREVNVVAHSDKKAADDTEPAGTLFNITNTALPFSEEQMNELIHDIDNEEKVVTKKSGETCFQEVEHGLENSALEEDEDWEVEATEANLEEELKILDQERLHLGDEQRRLERNAESVSSEMFIECQELLQMFGIPYIISPMEAEAQCAFMEIANLVDGVVTDDSDAFLFGAQSVYKNIFDDRKYVETYFMKDIENDLGLTREKLISMALLLGSDYTEGVSGIGIVNAIEVLNAFPEEGGLKEFRDWIESPDPTILGKLDEQPDSKTRRKGSRTGKNDSCDRSNTEEVSAYNENASEAQDPNQSADDLQYRKKMFMDKHRKVSKNWHFPSTFPSEMVVSAYVSPEIDKSTEPFSWGKPDHFVLRKLCWEKFGWDNQKSDELILPVLKEYNKRETQLRLEAFYSFNERFATIRSKRVKKAVKGITGKNSLGLMDDSAPNISVNKNKGKSKHAESKDNRSEEAPQGMEENVGGNQTKHEKKSTPKQLRKRARLRDGIAPESPVVSDAIQGAKKRSQTSQRGSGRTAGRGKWKGSPIIEVSETSSSDDDEKEVHMKTQQGPVELRRSGRARKPVDYAANDSETDDLKHSVNNKEASNASEIAASGLAREEECIITENVSPELGLETDYLEKGGGFCLDDGDNDQPDAEEYLKTGGGFCMDNEDETRADDDSSCERSCERATDLVVENADLSLGSDLNKKDANVSEPITNLSSAKTRYQSESSSSILLEHDANTSQRIPVGALRPMPHLRKKRRET